LTAPIHKHARLKQKPCQPLKQNPAMVKPASLSHFKKTGLARCRTVVRPSLALTTLAEGSYERSCLKTGFTESQNHRITEW